MGSFPAKIDQSLVFPSPDSKDVHRRQKLTTDFFKLFELTILAVIISISRKKNAYHGFEGVTFKGLDNRILGFVHI